MIKLKIHTHTSNTSYAVVSLYDGDDLLINEKSTQIQLNPDGSANTVWLNQFAKYNAYINRMKKLEKVEGDIL